jgi:copper homeostasis protein (lipoprotein)
LEIRGDYEALRALAVKVRQSYSPGRRNRPYSLAPCEKGRRRRDAREEDCPARVSTDREGSPVMKRFPVLCLVFLLAGCATHSAVVMGSASYRERMALLPGAVFEVTLEDVTKADAPAEIVGRTRLENPGNPPFDFAIPYDPKRILTNHRYEVRAKIRSGAELLFVTDASYPVLTLGHKSQAKLLLVRASGGIQAGSAGTDPAVGTLPARFVGDIPCADCAGIRYQVDLLADQVFFSRMTYQGRDAVFDQIGNWSVPPEGGRLVLAGTGQNPTQFSLPAPGRLRLLDRTGKEIDSKHNYELARDDKLEPLDPAVKLEGMYGHGADAGILTECTTGMRFSVLSQGDNAALERAYLQAHHETGQPLKAELEGRLSLTPPGGSEERLPVIAVSHFVTLWPGETCGQRFASSPLENSYWKLTRLGGTPVLLSPGQREPYLVLQAQDRKLVGYAGCNRMTGSYILEGETLRFGHTATTKMACVRGMDMEDAFLKTLDQVRHWQIDGEHLVLADQGGRALAQFEAVALP